MKIKTMLVLLGLARAFGALSGNPGKKGSKFKVIQAAPYYEMKFLKRAEILKQTRDNK